MATKKLSELETIGTINGSEYFYGIQDGISRKIPLTLLSTSINSAVTSSNILSVLSNSITETQLYSDLQNRINLIDGATTLAGSVNARVQAAKDYALGLNDSVVTQVGNVNSRVTNIIGASPTTALTLSELTTKSSTAESSIATLNTTTASQASSLTALTTRVGTAESSIATLNTTTSSQASSITQLNTRLNTVGGSGVTLEQKLTTTGTDISNLYGQYTLKIDNAGHVSGFGLASSTTSSDFIVNANRFSITAPADYTGSTAPTPQSVGYVWYDTTVNKSKRWSGTAWVIIDPLVPFIVQTTSTILNGITLPPGVYIDTAFIRNLTATNINLGNLGELSSDLGTITAGTFATSANSSGYRMEISSSSAYPLWYGTGTKTLQNSRLVVDTAGNVEVRGGAFVIKDSAGNITFGSGGAVWDYITGNTKPANNATRNVFLGNWTTATGYVVGDIVLDSIGYGWSCILNHTSSGAATIPSYPTTSNQYWTLYTVKGFNGISTILSNESHSFPATYGGNVNSYVNSGTDINVYDGTTIIPYDGVGISNGSWKVTATGTNITPSTPVDSGDYATYPAHSGVAQGTDVSSITYTITGKTSAGLSFTLVKTQTFTKSKAGVNPVTGFLTNESANLQASPTGVVNDFTPGNGNFKVYNGTTDITSSCTYSVASSTGCTVTINSSGAYSVSAMTTDNASATLRAVYATESVTLDKILSLTKAKVGASGSSGTNGLNAITITLLSDRQTIAYDANGNASPTTQTTTFTAQKQNTTAVVNWSITDASGVARTPVTSYLSAATGDSVSMTESQFASARNGTLGVIVTSSLTDGTTVLDKISVVRVAQGATGATGSTGPQGATGPTVTITSDRSNTFSFTDRVLDATNNGTITFTANITGMSGQTYAWTYKLDGATAVSMGTASTASLSSATFGSSKSAIITAVVTYSGQTYTDTITVSRLDKSTAAAGATVGATIGTNLGGTFTTSNIADFMPGTVIDTAQIVDGSITNAKIHNLSVDSAKIQDLAVTSGKIGNAQVDTLQIKDQAITIPASSTATSVAVSGLTTILSITFTSTGNPINISYGGQFFGWVLSSNTGVYWAEAYNFYLYRDSTQLAGYTNIPDVINGNFKDTPGAGTFTYTIKAQRAYYSYLYGSGGLQVRNPYLILMEVKK